LEAHVTKKSGLFRVPLLYQHFHGLEAGLPGGILHFGCKDLFPHSLYPRDVLTAIQQAFRPTHDCPEWLHKAWKVIQTEDGRRGEEDPRGKKRGTQIRGRYSIQYEMLCAALGCELAGNWVIQIVIVLS